MKILRRFSCVQIHNKQHNFEYSTHIILQFIQDPKMGVYV